MRVNVTSLVKALVLIAVIGCAIGSLAGCYHTLAGLGRDMQRVTDLPTD